MTTPSELDRLAERVDPRTGRVPGDHGSASDALDFALDSYGCDQPIEFLRDWREGAAFDEWPDFYAWLARREAASKARADGGGNG